MSEDDSQFHMVEFCSVGGEKKLVRGKRKTEAELATEAEDQPVAALQVRIVQGCPLPGGNALLLCDADGNALPSQVKASLNQSTQGAEITVTFVIDGEDVVFA
jgi:hypothetical protein